MGMEVSRVCRTVKEREGGDGRVELVVRDDTKGPTAGETSISYLHNEKIEPGPQVGARGDHTRILFPDLELGLQRRFQRLKHKQQFQIDHLPSYYSP